MPRAVLKPLIKVLGRIPDQKMLAGLILILLGLLLLLLDVGGAAKMEIDLVGGIVVVISASAGIIMVIFGVLLLAA